MKPIFLFILLFFAILGAFFSSILIHEIIHLKQMKGAHSICITEKAKISDNLQTGYLIAYTEIDKTFYSSIEEYNTVREESEKLAGIATQCIYIIMGMVFGFCLAKN